jgi:hypothetical protein
LKAALIRPAIAMLNAHFGDPELIAGYKPWMEKGELT